MGQLYQYTFSSSLFQLFIIYQYSFDILLSVLPYFNWNVLTFALSLIAFSSSLFQHVENEFIEEGKPTFSSSLFQLPWNQIYWIGISFQFFLISTWPYTFNRSPPASFSSSLFQPEGLQRRNYTVDLSVLPYFNTR